MRLQMQLQLLVLIIQYLISCIEKCVITQYQEFHMAHVVGV